MCVSLKNGENRIIKVERVSPVAKLRVQTIDKQDGAGTRQMIR